MAKLLTCALGIGASLLSQTAVIAQDRDQPQNVADDTIVVVGSENAESEIIEAAKRVSPDLHYDRALPRYIDPLCLAVLGFEGPASAGIKQMIDERAISVGIQVAPADCRPNALLVVVDDVPAFLRQAIDKQPRLASSAKLTKAESEYADGQAAVTLFNIETRSKFGRKGFSDSNSRASRISPAHSKAISSSVLTIDAHRLRGATYRQIADYGAMVLLGHADAGNWPMDRTPSILGLFNHSIKEAPARLTPFDEVYLRALYALPLNALPRSLPVSIKRELDTPAD